MALVRLEPIDAAIHKKYSLRERETLNQLTEILEERSLGQLNSNSWVVLTLNSNNAAFGATETTGDMARGTSTGGVSTGGIYAFQTSTGNSLGAVIYLLKAKGLELPA